MMMKSRYTSSIKTHSNPVCMPIKRDKKIEVNKITVHEVGVKERAYLFIRDQFH
jgi:hypothetical protein